MLRSSSRTSALILLLAGAGSALAASAAGRAVAGPVAVPVLTSPPPIKNPLAGITVTRDWKSAITRRAIGNRDHSE